MEILEEIISEILRFFRVGKLQTLFTEKGFDLLYTFEGITAVLSFLIPLILLYEIVRSRFIFKKGTFGFKMPMLFYVFNRLISKVFSIAMYAWCVKVFQPFAVFQTHLTWYWFLYTYVAWEFGHFLYHYWGHKVRLFWCFHGQHHAPEHMNLSVNFAHFFLEGPYATFIRTTTCMLLGVEPAMLLMVMAIDSIWGEAIHFSEETLKDGRLGFIGKVLLTPSHHRVHHSRNDLYMDTNFCNLLNIWDHLFGTYQEELPTIKPEYGVSRIIDTNNFWDMYFGELITLGHDVWNAPGILNKVKYIIYPPGWSHTGNHKTGKIARERGLASLTNLK